MDGCELLATCAFFNDKMENMPHTAELVKERYCRGDNSECARYVVYRRLGRPKVPADLFPNEMARAKQIISPK